MPTSLRIQAAAETLHAEAMALIEAIDDGTVELPAAIEEQIERLVTISAEMYRVIRASRQAAL